MNKGKTALICFITALMLTGCASGQNSSDSNGASSLGQPESLSTIGAREAEKAALDHAGITADEATITKTEYDSAKKEYEIDFTAGAYRYEYDISAENGSITEFSKKIIKPENNSEAGISSTVSDSGQTEPPKTESSAAEPSQSTQSAQSTQSTQAPQNQPTATVPAGNITLEEAKTAALTHAGLKSSDVTFTKTKLDRDDGREEYDIEFVTADYEYEYEIDAASGTVQSSSKEAISKPTVNPASGNITLEEAKTAALTHAGLKSSEVTFTKTRLDRDDGREEYDIEFVTTDYEYEYEIDAASGTVLSSSKEAISKPTVNPASGNITLEEAKTAALAHAGLKSSDVTFTKTKLDRDDGREEYDIEFVTVDYEYEYEIDAANGTVLSSSKEAISKPTVNPASGNITLEEAKTAALTHAGLKSSDVIFTKTKLDRDDGREEYEIEFTFGRTEYEYTIDAATGEIIEFDTDD